MTDIDLDLFFLETDEFDSHLALSTWGPQTTIV